MIFQMNPLGHPDASLDSLDWQVRRLEALRPIELLRIMRARQQVFVVEQDCPYLDADTADEHSWHLAAWLEGGRLCAYARVVDPGVNYSEASIGRVITAKAIRGRGLGRELMGRAIRHASALYPGAAIRISAQSHLRAFYAGFGFEAEGDIYQEDGIPHIAMHRPAVRAAGSGVSVDSRSAAPDA